MRIIQGIVSSQPPILPTATTIDERIDAFIAPLTRAVENHHSVSAADPGQRGASAVCVAVAGGGAALISTGYLPTDHLRGPGPTGFRARCAAGS